MKNVQRTDISNQNKNIDNNDSSAVVNPDSNLLIGITVCTGIRGDKDDLLVLDPKIAQSLSYEQSIEALIQFGKLTGKDFASFQKVQVDLNFNQTGKLMILQEYYNPYPCEGEVIHCSPNDKLIEYAKSRCK